MPIRISEIVVEGEQWQRIAWLADNQWLLPPQIELLEEWLEKEGAQLPVGNYVADIGFSWRQNAGGGGSTLSPNAMRTMAALGMTLWLSEYPGFADEAQ